MTQCGEIQFNSTTTKYLILTLHAFSRFIFSFPFKCISIDIRNSKMQQLSIIIPFQLMCAINFAKIKKIDLRLRLKLPTLSLKRSHFNYACNFMCVFLFRLSLSIQNLPGKYTQIIDQR